MDTTCVPGQHACHVTMACHGHRLSTVHVFGATASDGAMDGEVPWTQLCHGMHQWCHGCMLVPWNVCAVGCVVPWNSMCRGMCCAVDEKCATACINGAMACMLVPWDVCAVGCVVPWHVNKVPWCPLSVPWWSQCAVEVENCAVAQCVPWSGV